MFYYALGRGRDLMIVVFTNTSAISAYHHLSYEFVPCSLRGVLDTTLCYNNFVVPWFSPGPPVSSTNKTDRHDSTEILLKVSLSNVP